MRCVVRRAVPFPHERRRQAEHCTFHVREGHVPRGHDTKHGRFGQWCRTACSVSNRFPDIFFLSVSLNKSELLSYRGGFFSTSRINFSSCLSPSLLTMLSGWSFWTNDRGKWWSSVLIHWNNNRLINTQLNWVGKSRCATTLECPKEHIGDSRCVVKASALLPQRLCGKGSIEFHWKDFKAYYAAQFAALWRSISRLCGNRPLWYNQLRMWKQTPHVGLQENDGSETKRTH